MPKLSISRDEWLQAASYGNLDQLNRWHKSGALDIRYDPVAVGVSGGQGRARIFDVCSIDKENALFVAVRSNHVDYAKRLLGLGRFPETRTIEGRTAMHAAVFLREGSAEIVGLLHAQGYRVDAVDKKGKTPLLEAINNKRTEAFHALLDLGASPRPIDGGSVPLIDAVSRAQSDMVEALLRRGADPNEIANKNFSRNEVALHYAAALWERSDDENEDSPANRILRVLLEYGADVEVALKDSNGVQQTPAHLFPRHTQGARRLEVLIAEKKASELNASTVPAAGMSRPSRL